MSKTEKAVKLYFNHDFFDDFNILEENSYKKQQDLKKKLKKKYKGLKYICSNCGAFNHRGQLVCGICMSSHIRKATKEELYKSILIMESRKDIY